MKKILLFIGLLSFCGKSYASSFYGKVGVGSNNFHLPGFEEYSMQKFNATKLKYESPACGVLEAGMIFQERYSMGLEFKKTESNYRVLKFGEKDKVGFGTQTDNIENLLYFLLGQVDLLNNPAQVLMNDALACNLDDQYSIFAKFGYDIALSKSYGVRLNAKLGYMSGIFNKIAVTSGGKVLTPRYTIATLSPWSGGGSVDLFYNLTNNIQIDISFGADHISLDYEKDLYKSLPGYQENENSAFVNY